MNIRKLVIEDVRCFAGRQDFDIRPVTFLVGENSTGKSTALGCFQILADFLRGWHISPDFNVEPYQMGAFTDIVRKSRPGKTSFQMGLECQMGYQEETIEYLLTLAEREQGSEPIVQEQRIIFTDGEIVFTEEAKPETDVSDKQADFRYGLQVVDIIQEGGKKKFIVNSHLVNLNFWWLLRNLLFTVESEDGRNSSLKNKELYQFLKNRPTDKEPPVPSVLEMFVEDVSSFAPIRSKPQRTYNPLKEGVSPEGSDMPMLLMNLSKADEETWRKLKERLVEFGKTSGLFTDINVRRLGKSMGDPFQLQIKVKGPKANLIDVGYGVNQVLPILVRILNTHEKTVFLMQQPEVHLHPKGQAELSSLFVDIVQQREVGFVIETHSECMIDRARIEIMRGRIKPEDVSLIYLESVGNSVRVHNISFDGQANLLGMPSGYREFFLKESDKLLGID